MTDIGPELDRLIREDAEEFLQRLRRQTMTLTPQPQPQPIPSEPTTRTTTPAPGGPSVYERMIQEQDATELPPGATKVSRIRFALLHGDTFTAMEVATRYDVSPPTLSMIIADLERAGFTIARTKLPNRQVRMAIINLDHRPRPFVSRGTGKYKTPKTTASKPIRTGTLMADVADRLVAAYPDQVHLGNMGTSKAVGQAVYRLSSQRGWNIDRAEGDGTYRLMEMPPAQAPKRGRGRPKGSTKKAKPEPQPQPKPKVGVTGVGFVDKSGAPPAEAVTDADTTLSADDIFLGTVDSLYPSGQVPTEALATLIEWREQTAAMLTRLRSE